MAWDERFSERYDEWSSSMTADIDFYRQLAQRRTGPIVELAIGDGRVAIPIAKSLGVPIIGFDLSPAMLARARTRAAAAGVELDLRLGDIREFAVDEPAGFIYCPFRSLLHLPTWTGRRQLFERVAESLRPGGIFAWNAFAFDHRVAAQLDGVHQDHPVGHTNYFDVADNRIDIRLDDGGVSSLWWASRNEWLGLIDVAGLRLEALYGGFDRSPLGSGGGEYVFVTTAE